MTCALLGILARRSSATRCNTATDSRRLTLMAALLTRNVSGWKFRREYSKLAAKCGIYGDLGVSTGQRLGIGEYAALERCFTAKDVEDFANVSGDKNPVHLDEEFAKTTRFGGRIVHGMLCGSLFSTLFATRLPGSIYINQSLKFVKPVYINDTIEAKIIVKEAGMRTITCDTMCTVPGREHEIVIAGEATVLIPRRNSQNQ